jgi:hypothetical protein
MAIIVSKTGKNAVKLDKSSFEDEKDLQQFICQNPDSVPLYDIKADIKLLILAREFPTRAGAIDALGVDRDGEIYIVETKLYKNADKRAVVAQVLDYGANLWKYGQNFDDFISRIEDKLNTEQHASLNERLKEFYGLDEEEIENFRHSMLQHLIEGSFKFLVLMARRVVQGHKRHNDPNSPVANGSWQLNPMAQKFRRRVAYSFGL